VFYKTSEHHGLPHNPFKSCVVPRPIAWVSSIHPNGTLNLAPFSFFNALAVDPPMVMLAFNGYHEHGGEKDTLHNIKATGEFVVNMVPLKLKDAMNMTSAAVAHEVDEIDLAGLETQASVLVKPPRVAAAPIHLECELYQEIELPCTREDSTNRTIIGMVLGVHIHDEVLTDGLVDLTKVNPLARLGYSQYTSVQDIFDILRPGA
jgi:flavin reductase (DIM6/NTAB) family NADH-FMN oxidoreductase RutF